MSSSRRTLEVEPSSLRHLQPRNAQNASSMSRQAWNCEKINTLWGRGTSPVSPASSGCASLAAASAGTGCAGAPAPPPTSGAASAADPAGGAGAAGATHGRISSRNRMPSAFLSQSFTLDLRGFLLSMSPVFLRRSSNAFRQSSLNAIFWAWSWPRSMSRKRSFPLSAMESSLMRGPEVNFSSSSAFTVEYIRSPSRSAWLYARHRGWPLSCRSRTISFSSARRPMACTSVRHRSRVLYQDTWQGVMGSQMSRSAFGGNVITSSFLRRNISNPSRS
mmetsp:Transcript_80618/g.218328  ORF Transcript_80618/g.218328 Transcript_80618/m.218328 type:complete len:276 (-) Transcript_80618:253-1080(-)